MASQGGFDPADLPPIYVTASGYDDMGAILDRLEVPYGSTSSVDLDSLDGGVVLVNCKMTWNASTLLPGHSSFKRSFGPFVERGGAAVVSDLACVVVSECTDATFGHRNWRDDVRATVEDDELADLLGRREVTLDFDTAVKEPERLPAGARPLLRDPQTDTVIAYQFSHGRGEVVYTTFHNHSQTSEVEESLLRLLLMIPIAESAGTTVTETYTSIVEAPSVDADATGRAASAPARTDEPGDPSTPGATRAGAEAGTETTVRLELAGSAREGTVTVTVPASGRTRVGRSDLDHLLTAENAGLVSGTHLELRGTDGDLWVADADSTNGTRLNGRDVSDGEARRLSSGDRLSLAGGAAEMVVRY
jgi:hypothetical protein